MSAQKGARNILHQSFAIIAVLDQICSTCCTLMIFCLKRVAIIRPKLKNANGSSSTQTHIARQKHNDIETITFPATKICAIVKE